MAIYMAAVQELYWLYTLLPGVYIKIVTCRAAMHEPNQIHVYMYTAVGGHIKCLFRETSHKINGHQIVLKKDIQRNRTLMTIIKSI